MMSETAYLILTLLSLMDPTEQTTLVLGELVTMEVCHKVAHALNQEAKFFGDKTRSYSCEQKED